MQDRIGNGGNENPGPGDYASEKVKVVATVKDMMNNSFTTKVSDSFLARHVTNMVSFDRFRSPDSAQLPQAQVSTNHLPTSPTQALERISKV